jgi:hypothetical protein
MLNSVIKRVFATAVLALTAGAISASAQATRTWISGVGDDVNPCSRTAPCKSWQGAIPKTAAGGEIDALDPGGFGAVTITKSITLDGGVGPNVAGILVASTNGIIVNAPLNAKVTIRNLAINGLGATGSPGINGILYLAGEALRVENTHIFGFGENGINVDLSNNGSLVVNNTDIRDINNGSAIRLNTTSGMVLANLDHVRLERSGSNGLHAVGRTRVIVSNSVIALNGNAGILAESVSNNPNYGIVEVNNCEINMNNAGLVAGPGGVTIRVSNSHITTNAFNWQVNGGLLFSFGDNIVAGNNTTNPASAPAPTKM